MQILIKNISIFILFFFLLALKFLWLLDPILAPAYNLITQQKQVETFNINNFETISFEELPQEEQAKFKAPTCKKFNYSKLKFIKISWFDRYKNIIGNTKAYKLLTPDRLIMDRVRIPNLAKVQYLLIDSKVLDIYKKLITELKRQKLDTSKIYITSGFRNPEYNKIVNGARCSQHQAGNALDISIGDINRDGKENEKDRKIVYQILEVKLIRNKGGLGRYKNHPQLIHFDTRGYKARW